MGFSIENGVLKKYTKERGVTEVIVPEGVTEIGWHAFEDCRSLTSITLPDGVTEIGYSAFSGCRSLTSITLPDGVTEIGDYAFRGCSSLTSMTLPDSVTEIGEGAFSGTPYMFVTQVLINTEQPAAAAYVKKNFTKLARFCIDRNRIDELKRYEQLGFFTKANIGKHIEYALNREKRNNEIILYLLSVKDAKGGFKLEEIDKYIELALGNVELTATLLNYKNKYFTTEHIEKIETDRIEKELGFKERTVAEWKKIFSYEVKDGEVTITAYKGSDLDVIVPETICKKPVTTISDMAFSPCKPRIKKDVKETLCKLKSVYFGENIKDFGSYVFGGCKSLETIASYNNTIDLSKFGTYNGSPIKWTPLSIDLKNRTMLIIAEKPICDKRYNAKHKAVTWEKCTLRKWLNEGFYSLFTDEEKAMIAETTVVNSDNIEYGTKGGNDTTDKIFLLSIDEAEELFANDDSRAAGSRWWLRSPGKYQDSAADVNHDGSLNHYGNSVHYVHGECGVRPALNLKF